MRNEAVADTLADFVAPFKRGLSIERQLTCNGVDPYDAVSWELRDAVITGADGKVFFEQCDVEVPRTWSQNATNVAAQKYFRGKLGTPQREHSVRQMVARVVDTIYGWGVKDGYFKTADDTRAFRDELAHLLLNQKMAFNSPVWFNVGVHAQPQTSACFINSVEDSMESILDLAKREGMLFKYGSGTGSNLSPLRSSKEQLAGGGTASGPVSFIRGYDAFAGAIKSGGTTRRAARLQCLNVDHPDIVEFINSKSIEERKAWALIDAGYDGGFNVPGGAYDSVSFQNANHSVRVTDDFMQAVVADGVWQTKMVVTGEPCETHRARDLMHKMAEAAWICGDPGLQYDTTINDWHTCPNSGRINASNPCSEYMYLDDSACNLASLNLRKFQDEHGDLDVAAFRQAIYVTITAMDIIVGNSRYPTLKITENSHRFRPLGLGYANLGAFLMSRALPYDSDAGRAYAAAITAIMCGEAYKTSARLAAEVAGPFDGYEDNREAFLRVMNKHRAAIDQIGDVAPNRDGANLIECAKFAWNQAIAHGTRCGFRNGQATVLAPTGTIGILMDADTTGIEPDLAIVKFKRLVGGGVMTMINRTVEDALRRLSLDEQQVNEVLAYIDKHNTIEGAPHIGDDELPIFDCAFRPKNGARSIAPTGHIRMMAAVQPFLSGAISKTVNLPSDCTVEDIERAYIDAWRLGLKAIAVYRDGCKRTQPLSTSLSDATSNGRSEVDVLAALTTEERTAVEAVRARKEQPSGPPIAIRHRLSRERTSITHKFTIAGHEGYATVGLYEDGSPGELFIRMAKEGSALGGVMDSFATAVSIALQHGAPLATLVEKFRGTRFEPSGFTGNPEIPLATSIMDYLFRWLGTRFREKTPQMSMQQVPASAAQSTSSTSDRTWTQETDAPPCHDCGTLTVRNGACHKCPNCGSTSGCS